MAGHYSIRTAAQLSGLTPYVIRAWEKRYGVVRPERSEGNQRTYSDDDVRRLKLLASAVKQGRRISRLVDMSDDELALLADESEGPGGTVPPSVAGEWIRKGLDCVRNMNSAGLNDVLRNSVSSMGAVESLEYVVTPLMERLGEGWHRQEWTISHEHMASAVVRTVLGDLLSAAGDDSDAPLCLVASPAGQIHELGGLAVAVAASTASYRVVYLGSDVPAAEILRTVRELHVGLVILSIIFPSSVSGLRRELETLRAGLPEDCDLVLGGSSAARFIDDRDIGTPGSLTAFRNSLMARRR